jgi:ATP synthase protein I
MTHDSKDFDYYPPLSEEEKIYQKNLSDLEKKINLYESHDQRPLQKKKEQESSASMSSAGAGLISAVIVGLLLGMGIDYVFNTKPWGTLIFLFSGIIAGFKHLFQLTGSSKKSQP